MAPITRQATKALGNVVVIGGCGFLGHHIVNLLCDSYSAKISVLDIRTSANRRAEGDGVKYFDADITNLDSLLSIFAQIKPDVVIHTASPPALAETPKSFLHKVNVGGTKCIIEACQKTNVKALVFTSSSAVISNNIDDIINADEQWPVLKGKAQPDYYNGTKGEAEGLVLAANRSEEAPNLLTIALRPAGIYGEGDKQMTAKMVDIYLTGKTHFQIGTNDNLFDTTYVGNVAYAHALAASALLETAKRTTPLDDGRKVDGEAFNITNGQPIYFWDFCRVIWVAAGSKDQAKKPWVITKDVGIPLAGAIEFFGNLLGREVTFQKRSVTLSCMTRYYNIKKARERLGYDPPFTMLEGVKRSVAYDLAQREKAKEKKGQ